MEQSPIHEIHEIYEMLQEAKKYSLEAEVIRSALESMKFNPDQSIVIAMLDGLNEWIK
jgi:hypothetical protein